ncbi:MAG TPA: transketolase [Bacteroidales bacterium]|nr:transketolase [Bacteroidales bacterium]HPR58033.1 transketolase [Bacteroidales bacterium]HRW97826.1 transketolase [Bacteroidales bacterium]
MNNITTLKSIAMQVRRDILRMVHAAQSGHPGGALGCADFFVALYFDVLHHNPNEFDQQGRDQDVFLLSNGHLSAVWYSVLARSGYFDVSELATFRKFGSRLQGHPATHEGLPGVRFASGSLGQGLSCAIGMALGKKLDDDDALVYVLMGDGEIQEGQVWEAAMFAGGKKVDNLIAVIDFNQKQIEGSTSDVLPPGDLKAKWEAFDWEVLEMNGNDIEEVIDTLRLAATLTGNEKPVLILMSTEMGFGVDFMMGTHKWHGIAPNDEELKNALSQLKETLGDY